MKKIASLLPLTLLTLVLVAGSYFLLSVVTSKKSVSPKKDISASGREAYLTITAGRSPWQAGSGCGPFQALPNALTLEQVALRMKAISPALKAYATIVETYTKEGTERSCERMDVYANWQDLALLRDNYGWVVGSNGKTRRTKEQLRTASAQQDESCNALTSLNSHGHTKAWALFAYPYGDQVTTGDPVFSSMQENVVSKCFAYGRVYTYNANNNGRNARSEMSSPWWHKSLNVFGGKCNDSSSSCYNLRVNPVERRYTKPSDLINFVNVQPDQWANLQFHYFVEGKNGTQSQRNSWDCTDSNPNKHWATEQRLYCWNDFKYVLERIPSSVQVVTPDVVATAWGRTPPFDGTGPTLTPTPTPTPSPPEGEGGFETLTAYFFDFINFNGLKQYEGGPIDYDWGEGPPDVSGIDTSDYFGAIWVGDLLIPQTGEYTFYTQSDEAVQLWIGDTPVITNYQRHTQQEDTETITLTQGQTYKVKLIYLDFTGPSSIKLLWSGPGIGKEVIRGGFWVGE